MASSDQAIPQPPPLHPFFHRISYSAYQIIKIGFGTVFLLPLRALSMLVIMFLANALSYLATVGWTLEDLQTLALPPWRRAIRWFIVRVLMRTNFFIAGFHYVKTIGQRASSAEAPILVGAPHSSYFDSVPFYVLGAPSVVARLATRDEWLHGHLVDMYQAIYVSREDAGSRTSTVRAIRERVETIRTCTDGAWTQMLMYPEGTCGNRSCLVSFKPGAFLSGVPVQPVLLRFPNRIDTLTWTFDGIGLLKLLWLSLAQFQTNCSIEYLPVYTPSALELLDPNLYADNVRALMAEALGVPVVDYSFEDAVAMTHLDNKGLLVRLKGTFGKREVLSISPITELSIMRQIGGGRKPNLFTNKETFMRDFAPSNPDYAVLEDLFSCFEQRPHGSIDEREYLVVASLLNPALTVDYLIPPFFMMYTEGRRQMSMEEFTQFTLLLKMMPAGDAVKLFQSGTPMVTMDLDKFSRKIKKLLEYVKLLSLEVGGLLPEYPLRTGTMRN